jgi:hypothetical protein
VVLLGIVAIWVIVIAACLFSWLRDRNFGNSIAAFSDRFTSLNLKVPTIQPAHRLVADDVATFEGSYDERPPVQSPRLRVVPPNATQADMARQGSWEEWDRQYALEAPEVSAPHVRERASAFAPPREMVASLRAPEMSPSRRRTWKTRRRFSFTSLGTTGVTSLGAVATSWTFFTVLSLLSWITTAGYFSLMYYMFSQEELERAFPASMPRTATAPRVPNGLVEEPADNYFDVHASDEWDYAPAPRRAVGL